MKRRCMALDDAASMAPSSERRASSPAEDGTWIHFDYVPERMQTSAPAALIVTGTLCVIGSKLDEAGVAALFGV